MKITLLISLLAATGLAAPVAKSTKTKRNFDGIYVVGGEEGESAEKRNFDGIYVVGGEEGESAEKRNFDGIYVVGGEEGESAEKRGFDLSMLKYSDTRR